MINMNRETGKKPDVPDEIEAKWQRILDLMVKIAGRNREDLELQRAFVEIKQLKNRLEQETESLRDEILIRHSHDEIVGDSPAIKSVLAQAEKVADQETAVFILGETGSLSPTGCSSLP